MATYEERISAFAQGKRLLRMPRPIRNRADAFCDACGSTRPTSLCALKDLESGRYFFAGTTCVRELASKGVIARRYGKESGQVAYEREMQLRGEDDEAKLSSQESGDPPPEQSPTEETRGDEQPANLPSSKTINPTVLVIQYADHYTAFVSINADGSEGSGYAEESRWEERWRRTGIRGLVLEKVVSERAEAATRCITRAWDKAFSSQGHIERTAYQGNGPNGGFSENSNGLPDSLLALMERADLTRFGSAQVLVGSNGHEAGKMEDGIAWKR